MDTGLSTLEAALRALRQAWPDQWPGLPVVARSCLGHLDVDRGDPGCVSRIRCLEEISVLVERDGATRARAGLEPAYHNRLHVADTLVSLAVLIRAQERFESAGGRDLEVARSSGAGGRDASRRALHRQALQIEAMIAMVAHDYLHDGTVNRFRGQLEARSSAAVDAVLVGMGLPGRARARIRRWIRATDPLIIADHHDRINGRPFTIGEPDCLQTLINEADILVSSLPSFAASQTDALASERSANGIPGAGSLHSSRSRRQFLERVAIFTSDASYSLGLAQLRALQLEALGGGATEI
jgi:hypothetical protein